jgi:dihydrofolate synthase/folylpolyglutamate synthase
VTPRSAAAILEELERLGVRLGLETFRSLLGHLGNPERAVPVVLIAGTNGKGSTAAMLASIARRAGTRTGLATSPHLERVEERVRIDGRAISTAALGRHLRRILAAAAAAGLPDPTYFEATTAAAFLAFAEAAVDLAVVEVGMGGRLDATNATEPALSIVTPVALDHTAELGTTPAAVAGEKAGIFRAGRPALLAHQEPVADEALAAAAGRVGARLLRREQLARVVSVEWRGLDGHGLRLDLGGETLDLDLPLAGEHQIENAATAVAAARLLDAEGLVAIDGAALRAGVAATRWPGRLEPIAVPGTSSMVLLDAAHNPHGCEALAGFLDRLRRPFTLLFGALGDKQVAGMLPPLAERAQAVVLTRPESPRAVDPADLRTLVPAATRCEILESPSDALDAALAAGSELVVACGSIYLVGALRARLRA